MVDVSSDVSGKNITLTVDACNISGKLTVIGGHVSAAGVTVSLGPHLAVTGPDGSYVLTVPYGMSGDIIVSIPGYSQITVASVKDLFADISGKDLVLKANVYMVVFKDYGGSKISEVSVLWGDVPTVPDDPSRAFDGKYAYTFAGWSPSVGAYDGTVTSYTATYDATTIGKTGGHMGHNVVLYAFCTACTAIFLAAGVTGKRVGV